MSGSGASIARAGVDAAETEGVTGTAEDANGAPRALTTVLASTMAQKRPLTAPRPGHRRTDLALGRSAIDLSLPSDPERGGDGPTTGRSVGPWCPGRAIAQKKRPGAT